MSKINRAFIGSYLVFVAAWLSMSLVHATEYEQDSFVYYAKSDADSVFTDLHMQKTQEIVLLHGDIITPIDLSAGKSFNLTGSSAYTAQLGGYDSYSSWNGRTLLSSSVNVSADIKVLIGDFNGDGFKDQLLQAQKNTASSSLSDQTLIIVYGSNSKLPLKVETVAPVVNSGGTSSGRFNASASTISVSDYNGDGISDIELTSTNGNESGSSIQTYAFGSTQGIDEIKWELFDYQSITPTPITDGVLTSIPNITMPTAPASNTVGLEVGGKGSVSPTGSGSYSIPINVVPALSGFQPSLSLQYNSQALPSVTPVKLSHINPASGSIGLGWSIAGLSAVSRCQTDLTRETNIDAVDYDSNDQFCLDGQRLVLVSGTHGSSGAEYRTEMGGNARVFAVGAAGSGPQSFKVIGSNGGISEFGNTEDSRQEALGRTEIDRWNVSKVKNATGSEIDFNYEKDTTNFKYRITSIAYEGNTVSFNYDASSTVLKNSLSKIVTTAQSLEFKYISSVNDTALRLSEVRRCANLLCTSPTVFDWNTSTFESTSNIFSTPTSAIQAFGYWASAGEWSVEKTPRMMADVNGDGLSDIVGFASSGVVVALSDGDGTFTMVNESLKAFGYWASAGEWRTDKTPRMMADINGDGMADIVGFASSGVVVALSDGDGTFTIVPTGLNAFGYWASAGEWSVENTPRMLLDVNGDGLDDIVGFASSGVIVALSNGDGTFKIESSVLKAFGYWASAGEWRSNKTPRMFADVDGDGLPDIVGFASSGVVTSVNNYEAGVIETATNGKGIVTKFNYEDSINSDIYNKGDDNVTYPAMPGEEGGHPTSYAPSIGKVVSSIETKNGTQVAAGTSYLYEGMNIHRLGMGSLGFAKLTTTNSVTGIKNVSEFEQKPDWRLIGIEKFSQTIAPNNTVLKSTTSTWEYHSTAGSIFNVRLRKSSTQNKSLSGVNTFKKDTYYCVSDYDKCTEASSSYDAYGNMKIVRSTIIDQQNGGETFSTHTTNEYFPLNSFATSNDYYTSQINKVTVTKSGSKRVSKTRVSEFNSYYANGKLKKETIEPDGDQLITEYEYSGSFGRLSKKTVSGTNIVTRTSSVTYDSSNPYKYTSTNALGHTSTTELSPLWGSVIKQTSANDISTHYAYDDFGRLQMQVSPDGSTLKVEYINCDASCPVGAVYYNQTTGADGISSTVSKVYADALNRTVATSSLGFDGREILTRFLFDEKGRQYKTSLPYFVGETVKYKTNSKYDELNRVKEVTHPDDSKSTVIYNGLSTEFYNAKNQKTITVKNALGQVIKSIDDDQKVLTMEYGALGNLATTTDQADNKVEMYYDIRGHKTSMNDPDKGNWLYKYNGLGQLVLQTDAMDQTTCMAYDKLGRMTKRIDLYQGTLTGALAGCTGDTSNIETANWEYDTSPIAGIGKLHRVSNVKGYAKEYSYDVLGRIGNSAITMPDKSVTAWGQIFGYDGKTYNVGQTYYANTSKVDELRYPVYNGEAFTTKNRYNARGFLYQTQDALTNTNYWTANGYNARGQLTRSTLGNGVSTTNVFDPNTGMIDTIDTTKGATNIQYLDYDYDSVGNLNYRDDSVNNLVENFTYDDLNRLKTSVISGAHSESQSYTYDTHGLGNLKTKTGVGTFDYGQTDSGCAVQFAGPHAVTSITGGSIQGATNYCYNQNGDMVSGAGRSITYTAFGKPSLMSKGETQSVEFIYGPGRNRVHRIDNKATTTTYVEGVYEELETAKAFTGKYYIGNSVVVTKESSSKKTRYLHHDHLGSVEAITNEVGIVVDRMSFDAWGKRRNIVTWSSLFDLYHYDAEVTQRGYTGQEQIDSMGLIHMNGRVYDPILARFISADPLIQAPTDMQSYNRYAYVRNNPLSYTDPTGYSWLSNEIGRWGDDIQYEANHFYESVWKKHGDVIASAAIAVAVCYFTGPAGCAAAWEVGVAAAATTATLKTPGGQEATRSFAGNLEDLGVDERHSYFLSYMILSAGLNSAYSAGIDYASGKPAVEAHEINPNEKIGDPSNPNKTKFDEIMNSKLYVNRGDDWQADAYETGTRPGSRLYELRQGDKLVGHLGTSPMMDVPGLTHTAAVLTDGSGAYYNSMNGALYGGGNLYAVTGTCHQMTNSAISSAGYSGTVQTMANVSTGWSGGLTMAVYGRTMGSSLVMTQTKSHGRW